MSHIDMAKYDHLFEGFPFGDHKRPDTTNQNKTAFFVRQTASDDMELRHVVQENGSHRLSLYSADPKYAEGDGELKPGEASFIEHMPSSTTQGSTEIYYRHTHDLANRRGLNTRLQNELHKQYPHVHSGDDAPSEDAVWFRNKYLEKNPSANWTVPADGDWGATRPDLRQATKTAFFVRKAAPAWNQWLGEDQPDHQLHAQVPIAELKPHALKQFDHDDPKIQELVPHIKANGIQNPINVLHYGQDDMFVSDGNHRLQAAEMAGMTHVPVNVYNGKSDAGRSKSNRALFDDDIAASGFYRKSFFVRKSTTQMMKPSELFPYARKLDPNSDRYKSLKQNITDYGYHPEWPDNPPVSFVDGPSGKVLDNGSHRVHILHELGQDDPISVKTAWFVRKSAWMSPEEREQQQLAALWSPEESQRRSSLSPFHPKSPRFMNDPLWEEGSQEVPAMYHYLGAGRPATLHPDQPLISSQGHAMTDLDKVDAIRKNGGPDNYNGVHVMEHEDGSHMVLDGHHRILADRLDGKSTPVTMHKPSELKPEVLKQFYSDPDSLTPGASNLKAYQDHYNKQAFFVRQTVIND